MALRSGQGQRKKYLTMDLSNLSTFVRNLRAVVSEFQFAKIGAQCTAPGALRPAPGLWLLRDAIGGGWSRRAGFAPGYRRARAPEPASGLSRSTVVPGPDTPATTDTGRQRGDRRPQSPGRSARRGRASVAGHTGPARAARGYTRAPPPHEKTRYSP